MIEWSLANECTTMTGGFAFACIWSEWLRWPVTEKHRSETTLKICPDMRTAQRRHNMDHADCPQGKEDSGQDKLDTVAGVAEPLCCCNGVHHKLEVLICMAAYVIRLIHRLLIQRQWMDCLNV